jgi:hypothetical protein
MFSRSAARVNDSSSATATRHRNGFMLRSIAFSLSYSRRSSGIWRFP